MDCNVDVGCGAVCRPGYIGVDIRLGGQVRGDVEHLPFRDQCFTHVYASHLLEHVDMPQAMRELHRTLVDGGTLEVRVPHASGIGAWSDPTHRRAYTCRTWRYFAEGTYGLPVFRIRRLQLCWRPLGQWQVLSWLFGLWPLGTEKYLAPWIGGYHEVCVTLVKPSLARDSQEG